MGIAQLNPTTATQAGPSIVARQFEVTALPRRRRSRRDKGPVPGADPERRSYFSRASFADSEGNQWQLPEVTERLPGRV